MLAALTLYFHPAATGVKILVNGQAANPELVKGQAHLRVKVDTVIV